MKTRLTGGTNLDRAKLSPIIAIIILMAIVISINEFWLPLGQLEPLPRLEVPRSKGFHFKIETIEWKYEKSIPDEFMIYKSNPLTKEDLLNHLEQFRAIFDIHGSVKEEDSYYRIRESDQEVKVDKSTGRVSYHLFNSWSGYPDEKPNLPSNSEAIRFAEEFFQAHSIRPPFASYDGYRIDCYPGEVVSNGEGNRTNLSMTVSFDRYINKCLVNGIGTGCSITLGNNMTILGCSKGWLPYSPYRKYPLHSKTEILQSLKRNGIEIHNLSIGPVSKAVITNISIHYYQDHNDLSKPYYLQPLFVVQGEVIGRFGNSTFWEYVEAVRYPDDGQQQSQSNSDPSESWDFQLTKGGDNDTIAELTNIGGVALYSEFLILISPDGSQYEKYEYKYPLIELGEPVYWEIGETIPLLPEYVNASFLSSEREWRSDVLYLKIIWKPAYSLIFMDDLKILD